jgi:hypothetical protein
MYDEEEQEGPATDAASGQAVVDEAAANAPTEPDMDDELDGDENTPLPVAEVLDALIAQVAPDRERSASSRRLLSYLRLARAEL